MKTSSTSHQETNTSPAWYLQLFSFISSSGLVLKEILAQIPEMFYPDNPAKDSLFPYINASSALSFLTYLTPVALLLNIKSTWESIKKFYYAKNKNFEKSLDLTVKIINTGASATYMGLALFGGVSLMLTAAPYLLIAVAGVGALYGIFNIGKHIYRAYKTTDKEKAQQTRFERVKQFGSVAISGLALAVTYYLGIKVNGQFSELNGRIFHDLDILKTVGSIFKAAIPVVYAFSIAAAVGVVLAIPSLAKAAWKMNRETISAIKSFGTHPLDSIKQIGNQFLQKNSSLWRFVKKTNYFAMPLMIVPTVLELVTVAVKTALRIPALILHPAVYLIHKIRSKFESKTPIVAKEVVVKAESSTVTDILSKLDARGPRPRTKSEVVRNMRAPVMGSTPPAAMAAELDYDVLCLKMHQKIEQLEKYGANISEKDNAKLALIRNIKRHFEMGDLTIAMIDGFVKDAKKISGRVFQSFWREVGGVEEIVRDVKKYILTSAIKMQAADLAPVAVNAL